MSCCSLKKRSHSLRVITTWRMPAGDQPTLDVPPQLHDGNAEINCGFFDLEGTSIAKCDSFGPFLEFFFCQRFTEALASLCTCRHNTMIHTPTYSDGISAFFEVCCPFCISPPSSLARPGAAGRRACDIFFEGRDLRSCEILKRNFR